MKQGRTPLQRYKNLAIGIGIVAILIFVASRFGHVIIGPRIILDATPTETLTEPAFTLSGSIKGGSLFWINDVQVPVDTAGRFETQLVVPEGYSIIQLEAEDSLGTRREKWLPVYYLPPALPSSEVEETPTSDLETAEQELTTEITNTPTEENEY